MLSVSLRCHEIGFSNIAGCSTSGTSWTAGGKRGITLILQSPASARYFWTNETQWPFGGEATYTHLLRPNSCLKSFPLYVRPSAGSSLDTKGTCIPGCLVPFSSRSRRLVRLLQSWAVLRYTTYPYRTRTPPCPFLLLSSITAVRTGFCSVHFLFFSTSFFSRRWRMFCSLIAARPSTRAQYLLRGSNAASKLGRSEFHCQPYFYRHRAKGLGPAPGSRRGTDGLRKPQPGERQGPSTTPPAQRADESPLTSKEWLRRRFWGFWDFWGPWKWWFLAWAAISVTWSSYLLLDWRRYRDATPITGRTRYTGRPSESVTVSAAFESLRSTQNRTNPGMAEAEERGLVLRQDYPLTKRVQHVLERITLAAGLEQTSWRLYILNVSGKFTLRRSRKTERSATINILVPQACC